MLKFLRYELRCQAEGQGEEGGGAGLLWGRRLMIVLGLGQSIGV